jgi:Zn-finger nucleic acid-binding protein
VRLVACTNCHAQYDVSEIADGEITCRCGTKIENRVLEGVDAKIHRCGACGAQVAADARSCDYCASEIVRDTRKLSLICPECYGRNAENSRYCTACGVAFRPEPAPQEGREIPCPCCGCLMPARAIGGVGINECPECNGIWVPEDRFDQLITKACEAAQGAKGIEIRAQGVRESGGNPSRARVVYRKCPVCDAHMQRSNFRKRSGVIIDRCHTHGTWLDPDELEQIAGFILSGGQTSPTLAHQPRPAAEQRATSEFARLKTRHVMNRSSDRHEGSVVVSILETLTRLLR